MPSFVTGTMVIDAPASALNNSGEKIPMARTDNTSSVKYIRANDGKTYPYVSAQAARYWLRDTLRLYDSEWRMSEVYREDKVAYTDANPIEWWDDDLLATCAHQQERRTRVSRARTPLSSRAILRLTLIRKVMRSR
jgi:CRISPR-associated protein Cst2